MVVDILWPDNAPWWLNLFIWMATFWWYILIGFVPAFYIAVAKLFGFPLLQRWRSEVIIMLYPTKVMFGKITEQFEPYFSHGKGVYWFDSPLQPEIHQELDPKVVGVLSKLQLKYEKLGLPDNKTKDKDKIMNRILLRQNKLRRKMLTVDPGNQLHIYAHTTNQPIYKSERRETKIDEILNNSANPKKIKGHGVWLMQNPRLHFHRHYQLHINPEGTAYKLVPVKHRQQFAIGFWHSLGIVMQKYVEVEEQVKDDNGNLTGNTQTRQQLVETAITTHVILQQTSVVQNYQNFSASRAFMLLKRRAKIEDKYNGFSAWIQGTFDMRIILLLVGLIAGVAMIFMLFHGGGSGTTTPGTPTTGGLKIL